VDEADLGELVPLVRVVRVAGEHPPSGERAPPVRLPGHRDPPGDLPLPGLHRGLQVGADPGEQAAALVRRAGWHDGQEGPATFQDCGRIRAACAAQLGGSDA